MKYLRCATANATTVATRTPKERELLDLGLFERAVRNLASINYRGVLTFHQFNEPLLEPEHLFACIDLARRNLPGAYLRLFTNGDLLTRPLLEKIVRKGVNSIDLSCHLDPGETWSMELALSRVSARNEALGFPYEMQVQPEKAFTVLDIEDMNAVLRITCQDFRNKSSNRMGTVEGIRIAPHDPDKICDPMLHFLNISYTGAGYICYDCCHGVPGMERYALGSLRDSSIFEVYAKKIPFIREYLFGRKPKCCIGCFWG